jgi:hypothetical protein
LAGRGGASARSQAGSKKTTAKSMGFMKRLGEQRPADLSANLNDFTAAVNTWQVTWRVPMAVFLCIAGTGRISVSGQFFRVG